MIPDRTRREKDTADIIAVKLMIALGLLAMIGAILLQVGEKMQ